MNLIKIKDIHLSEEGEPTYINVADISCIKYNKLTDTTSIFVNNDTFEVEGDVASKIARTITTTTNGTITYVE